MENTANLAIDAAKERAKAAEEERRNVEKYYENLADLWTFVILLFGGAGLGFGFYEAHKRDAIETQLKDYAGKATDLNRKLDEKVQKVEELDSKLKEFEGRTRALDDRLQVNEYDVLRVLEVPQALSYVALAEVEDQLTKRNAYFQRAAALLSSLVVKDKLSAPLRSWGYANLGYIHKRLGDKAQALQNVEKALALVPNIPAPDILYNAACYSTLLSDDDKALDYLRRAMELKPELKKIAWQDPDFERIRDDERFMRLVQ